MKTKRGNQLWTIQRPHGNSRHKFFKLGNEVEFNGLERNLRR
jgi:hypothetical protein